MPSLFTSMCLQFSRATRRFLVYFNYTFLFQLTIFFSCAQQPKQFVDLLIKNGTIYDGTGQKPYTGDVAICADTIAAMGNLSTIKAKKILDAKGLAISPGFINMLSWADRTLLEDGRAMSDIKQGVTLEIFGEGWSPGPRQKKSKSIPWATLGEYFAYLKKKGSSPNFASFVGATTIRSYVLGSSNRNPSYAEMQQMKALVRQAMKEGALGLGSSLIYAPANYASTEELIELCKVVSEYDGMYITHMRNESDHILTALDEVFKIAQQANVPAEIYHLKINNKWNWNKIDAVLFKIDSARAAGLKITANMYPYHASGTTIAARLPTWIQEGGAKQMRIRFKDPILRKKVLSEMSMGIPSRNSDTNDVMFLDFRLDSLNKLYRGKRLYDVAKLHGKNADETVLDLLSVDKSSIPSIFFLMSEDNIERMIQQPYVSICSDAITLAAEPHLNQGGAHPRAYGSFARFLAKYVRKEKLMPLEEAIRRMTSLPATNLKIKKRGTLAVGNYADLVIFDSATIQDHATFEKPHQYATGVHHVWVNGVWVLKEGNHTGAKSGKLVRR